MIMRTRVTYVHDPEGQFDPQQASVDTNSLSVRALEGARELKVTVGLDELPQELQQVLKQTHELHVRWAAERSYPAVAPFASRISPGLHISYTASDPRRAGDPFLCPLLRKAFSEDLKCSIPEVSFIPSPVASSRSLHFYQLIPSLENLVTYIQQKICSRGDDTCHNHVSTLSSVDYIDMNYDATSSSVFITAYWAQSPHEDGWADIHQTEKGKVEVGVLATQQPLELGEIRLGGFLAVVGEDRKLKPTLFSFPSRHHILPDYSTYRASFPAPTGLHPTLKLSMPRETLSPPRTTSQATCSLHTFLTLPSTVFADKYQLSTTDQLFLQSHNLISLRSIAGETDLEVPDWVTESWGSNLLLELATPQTNPSKDDSGDWEVTIPLHLRYLHPSGSGYRNVSVPWPIVFWACAGDETKNLDKNPFDRVHLGWDELFTPKTTFYQLNPSPLGSESGSEDFTLQPKLVEQIQVPVLRIDDGAEGTSQIKTIEFGTLLVVVFGFMWVLSKLGLVARSHGVGTNNTDKEKES